VKLAAAKASALLSVLFLVVYHSCNWITAQRSDVGTFYFGWERFIPFIPFFILPYMSIDLFFVAGPFLCSDRQELRTFSRRITMSILIAGACFLAMPLTLAVPRPQPDGWLGAIFKGFCAVDRPFNLFPSLHIALRTLLAHLYARHTHGVTHLATQVWFSLIGLSTLFTYQHHVIDVAGGFILAALCFYFVQESPTRLPVTPNPRVGVYYMCGAIACALAAWLTWWWGMVLLWPAFAFGVAAAGYFGAGPSIYRKQSGRIPRVVWWLLAPVLLGQRLSLLHYQRQCRAWDEAAPGVLIGRQSSDDEATQAIREGVTAALDLTAEFSEAAPFTKLAYRNLPILDLTAPTPAQLEEAVAFIREHVSSGKVYVHCKIGYSRSAAVVGVWLLASGRASNAAEAMARLRAVRPSIVIRPEAIAALEAFSARISLPVL
jgi:predicted protein tyrosine phosphatase/membrane-associated phospholipid phosphatase